MRDTFKYRLLSRNQVANMLGIGKHKLHLLINEGKIEYLIIGGAIYIAEQALIKFIEMNSQCGPLPVALSDTNGFDFCEFYSSPNQKKITSNSSCNAADIIEELLQEN